MRRELVMAAVARDEDHLEAAHRADHRRVGRIAVPGGDR
jgi:hypothetical protein